MNFKQTWGDHMPPLKKTTKMYRDWAIHVYLMLKCQSYWSNLNISIFEKSYRELPVCYGSTLNSQTQTGFQRLAKLTYLSYFDVKTIILNDEKLRQVDRPSLLNRPELRLVEL